MVRSAIEISVDVGETPLDEDAVRAAATEALAHGGRSGLALSIALVDDATLAALHERCLGDPSPTDVMSFDFGDEGPASDDPEAPEPGGEVIVSVDRAIAVAAERGVAPERELALYVVHGVLHLCGFDDHDEDDRSAMRAAESTVMERLGYPPDRLPHDR